MWDDTSLQTLGAWALAGVAVAVGLGFLRRSKVRTALITIWAGLPVIIVCWAIVATAFDTGGADWAGSFGFAAVFIMFLLPPWALLTLFPYNLVSRMREPQRWKL